MKLSEKERLLIYTGELADRALRFYQHLEVVNAEFYGGSTEPVGVTIPQDKVLFLNHFRECLLKVLQACAALTRAAKSDDGAFDSETYMRIAKQAFCCINQLHETGLNHLPRPSEPVELRRFCRIISKHVLKDQPPNLTVYITESTTDGALLSDPAVKLKRGEFENLVEITNAAFGSQVVPKLSHDDLSSIHVTIARIDARNPVRWPTLMHEAAHKLLDKRGDGRDKPLEEQFQLWLSLNLTNGLPKSDIKLKSWLTEAWCDLFAALVMGPAFFFSQFSAFIAAPTDDQT